MICPRCGVLIITALMYQVHIYQVSYPRPGVSYCCKLRVRLGILHYSYVRKLSSYVVHVFFLRNKSSRSGNTTWLQLHGPQQHPNNSKSSATASYRESHTEEQRVDNPASQEGLSTTLFYPHISCLTPVCGTIGFGLRFRMSFCCPCPLCNNAKLQV